MTPEERMRRLSDPERWNAAISPRPNAFGAKSGSQARRGWSPFLTLAAVLSIAVVVGVGISATIVGAQNTRQAAPVPVPTVSDTPTPTPTASPAPTVTMIPTPTRTPNPKPTKKPSVPAETIESLTAKIETAGYHCKIGSPYDPSDLTVAYCSIAGRTDLAISFNSQAEIEHMLDLSRASSEPEAFLVGSGWTIFNERVEDLQAAREVVGGAVVDTRE